MYLLYTNYPEENLKFLKELDDNHFEFSNCRPGERIAPETSPEDLQDSGNVFWFPGQSGDYQ